MFDLVLRPSKVHKFFEHTIANPNFGFQKQLFDFEVNGGAQKVSVEASIKSPRVKDASFCNTVW